MGVINTGRKIFQMLEQYSIATGIATGVTKANLPSDPDYIPPVIDHITCPPPPPISIEDMTQVSVRIANKTTQLIVVDNLLIQMIQDPTPFYNETYSKGGGQEMFLGWRKQSSNSVYLVFDKIKGPTFSQNDQQKRESPKIVKCKIRIFWESYNTQTETSSNSLLFESNEFELKDMISIETLPLPIPFQQLYQINSLYVEFTDREIETTTTTTTKSTTTTTTTSTTTTSTTTTTTRNPKTNALTLNSKSGSQIKSITIVKDDVEEVIQTNVASSLSVKQTLISRGTYKVLIELTGPIGGSIRISDLYGERSQEYLGDDGSGNPKGVYVFEDVNAEEGLVVTFSENTSPQKVVYARLEEDSISSIESTAVLPYGKIEKVLQSKYIRFYEDFECTIPAQAKITSIKYRQNITGTINAVDDIDLPFNIDVQEVPLNNINQYKQWDYTLNNPNVQEADDLIEDLTYSYSLISGFGYIVVE